jgi:sec-independent protein translocase protein TatB
MMPTGPLAATFAMLSMTHMIVLFIVVLVVFGPHKLPELARGLGKLMAEFRKASTDFKSAFEQEMRDIERQALQAERKKAAEAAALAAANANQPATLASPAGTESPTPVLDADTRTTEAPVVTPSTESIARSEGYSEPANGSAAAADPSPEATSQTAEASQTSETAVVSDSSLPAHDQQHSA